jgi:enoyl-CoA hydratase/3-hydroxyacyl-CoA dehydrogenase
MGFTETGIGIIPGLGGMLRLALHVGPELAKYYVFTGNPISAEDAHNLGIITRLVLPADVPAAIMELASREKPDKYAPREISKQFKTAAQIGSNENVSRLLSGQLPQGVPDEIAAKTAKFVGYKAPLALKIANEIIDEQVGKSITEAVEIELSRLNDIFSTADALEGLSSFGRKKPEYSGA